MTSMTTRVTQAMRAAADYCKQVQGFHYGADFVIRDCNKPAGEQELFRAPYDPTLIGARMTACHEAIATRMVLEAMRDPSDAMLGALHGCHPDTPTGGARTVALETWRRAIDTALAENDAMAAD